jgi:streptogramin lyase
LLGAKQEELLGAKGEVVALGERWYKTERSWAKFPDHITQNVLTNGSVDNEGNLYLCQRTDPPVLVFDRGGRFLRGMGEGLIDDAHGIYVSRDGSIFVVDRDGQQVVKFDRAGRVQLILGQRQKPKHGAPFNHPTAVAEGPQGDIYVADGYGNALVHQFSAAGELKRSWGGFGAGPGEFTTPHGIKAAPDGRVLVGDRENNRVQVFDREGRHLEDWRNFYHPMDIYIADDGMVFVTDQTPSLQVRDASGKILGRCRPTDAFPHGITGDHEGKLYVVESRTQLVTRLTRIV